LLLWFRAAQRPNSLSSYPDKTIACLVMQESRGRPLVKALGKNFTALGLMQAGGPFLRAFFARSSENKL
jgi:hypothetical protein